MDTPNYCDLQSICTVSQMAQKLRISRARLYQLINEGVFPPPAYCCRSRKPLYPHRIQEICLQIQKTGIDFNGRPVRFCRPRTNAKQKREHKDMATILRGMGLSVSPNQVKKGLRQLGLPTAAESATNAETIRKLFQHLYRESQKDV